jgi:hypothetical protein
MLYKIYLISHMIKFSSVLLTFDVDGFDRKVNNKTKVIMINDYNDDVDDVDDDENFSFYLFECT